MGHAGRERDRWWSWWTASLSACGLVWLLGLVWTPQAAAQESADSAALAALHRAQAAVVGVQVAALEDARSNATLGRSRTGSGIVIGQDGLVLTIGYLVLEADQVLLLLDDGKRLPARVLGWDAATGLGLVQALAPLPLPPVPLGSTARLSPREPLMVVSGGADGSISLAQLVARAPYSGYWEYHLDEALYTAPARRDHSGAGLFNRQGELVGVGSLWLNELPAAASGADAAPAQTGNLFVPAQLLPPILAELRDGGSSLASRRAWLGVNCIEHDGELRVLRVNADSPADAAGLQRGDRIVSIDGVAVATLAQLWRTLWSGGAAERDVQLDIERYGQTQTLTVHTVDRHKTLRRPAAI